MRICFINFWFVEVHADVVAEITRIEGDGVGEEEGIPFLIDIDVVEKQGFRFLILGFVIVQSGVFLQEDSCENVQECLAVFGGVVALDKREFRIPAHMDDVAGLHQQVLAGVYQGNNLERMLYFHIVSVLNSMESLLIVFCRMV